MIRAGLTQISSLVLLLVASVWCREARSSADCRTLFGVARGSGEVTVSPTRGCRFHSERSADLAFACSGAALPARYRVTVTIDSVDIEHSGARFGIFLPDVRFGGTNAAINALTKLCVSFQETRGRRRVYITSWDRDGGYRCWDGREWHRDAWRPTPMEWSPQQRFRIVLERTDSVYRCCVDVDGQPPLEMAAAKVTDVNGAGRPEIFACGDMVTDYVKGTVVVSNICTEEIGMEEHSDSDIRHTVIRQAPEGRYAMYGGLTQLPSGDLACFFKVGSRDPETGSPWTVRDETIVWTRSGDGGLTWQDTESVIYQDRSTRQEICCGNAWVSNAGVLMQAFYILNPDYEERAKPENWSRVYLAVSKDNGESWQVRRLQTPLALAASFGGFLRLKDGTLLLNVYGAREAGTFRHESGFIRSSDDGLTWGEFTLIGGGSDSDGGPAKLNETDLVELPDGRLLSMSRTQYSGFPLYQGQSADSGRTWQVAPNGLTGLCPSLLYCSCGPPEGTVVLAYHDRYGAHAARGGMYLAFSQDYGRTWGEPVWISPGAYPCLLELEPGTALCSYYRDCTLLRGSIFRVPFPSGLVAQTGAERADACGVRLHWDRYAGKAARAYRYCMFRSEDRDVPVGKLPPLATVGPSSTFEDTDLEPGRMYFYRVVAMAGQREVGRSWVASARAGMRHRD